MMPLSAVRQMKDSGIDWVGQVPSHWSVRPFYSFAAEVDHPNTGLKEKNLLSLSYGRLVRKDMDRLEGLTPASFEGYNIIEANDIVFRLTDLQNDKTSLRSARSPERGIITSAYVTVRPSASPRFFEYLMRAYDTTKVFYGIGGGIRQSMKFDDLKRLPVLVPTVSEMDAIASHLDRATTRIDALVAKKTRFIELLREKRQALITHAVTKGLDRDVAMKDSGVEWLGVVPAHWDVVQSRRLFSERNEKARADDQQLTASQKYGLLPQAEFMEREGRRIVVVQKGHDILKRTLPGDFVISMRSFQGGLELSEYEGSVSSAYVPITPIKWVVPAYFRWAFKSITYIQALQATSDLVRDGQALRFENFTKVPLPHVPVDEQIAIADFLDRATTRIDTLIAKTERSIELLREHRTALITAAVTGKIDLRPAA
ncbi:restriction endonuclease subunit S [Stenotrophomonas sp. PS02297]|uniref:restriction endonuclease subunit S n=1 Tax=Stenotrophomonas sp. PS02297 TaxID=2991423 RepID=UPI00249AAA25|nr:restriction endonuclease subunit S [Stenotrophomonas sp. PS02297]